jgi:cysteine desulfurase/selenocysteine lyase
MSFDAEVVRKDFPIFDQPVHGDKRLVYLDSAATAQKPRAVIDRVVRFYETENANAHRGIYELGEKATAAFEEARDTCARFVNSADPRSIVFTRGTTESINLVRYTWARTHVGEGDEVLVTEMEHHSNLIPWQLLCEETGATLRHLPIDEEGRLRTDLLDEYITDKTRLACISQMSNVLGTINPVRTIADAAHAVGALVLVDAAQGAPHLTIDVAQMDCDFLAFSAHKLGGPTGAGVLWAREQLLEEMPPFHGGGEMISEVWPDHATYADIPHKFEAGTMNVAQCVGMAAAIDYLDELGHDAIMAHETELTTYAMRSLADNGAVVYGPRDVDERGGVVSFNLTEVHPHDLATIVDQDGICVRAGHHCAQPLMRVLDVAATARASFFVYNTKEDVDALVASLDKAKGWFA